jgi:hypothetical protein
VLRKFIPLSVLVFLTLTIGCGSVSNNNPTPTPTPIASPTPTPVASPTPTPVASPTPTADALVAAMVEEEGRFAVQVGTLTLDTTANNGAGTLAMTGSTEISTAVVLQFCQFPVSTTAPSCLNLASFTTDAKGAGTVNFTFPQPGTFAGLFQLSDALSGAFAASGPAIATNAFNSPLLPAGTVTSGIGTVTGHAPGSGRVTFTFPTAHITLSGTTPNHTFTTAACGLSTTGCTPLANITTDAQGNASADVGQPQPGGITNFTVSDADGVEFISAFRVN